MRELKRAKPKLSGSPTDVFQAFRSGYSYSVSYSNVLDEPANYEPGQK